MYASIHVAQSLQQALNGLLGFIPNLIGFLIISVIIFVIATAVGGAVVKLMGDTPTGKVVGTGVPVLIMGIAVFMILNQLRIAPAIVEFTYIALLGSVALGSALAFGLGGREVAGQMLVSAYEKGQQNAGQVKSDVQTGKQRGQEQAGRAPDAAQQKLDEGDGPAARRWDA